MARTTLKVTGMSCGHCVKAVTQALESVDGVRQADVDLGAGQATVEYDEALTSPMLLANAVTEEGYATEAVV